MGKNLDIKMKICLSLKKHLLGLQSIPKNISDGYINKSNYKKLYNIYDKKLYNIYSKRNNNE